MDQKREFVVFAAAEGANVRELCRRFGMPDPASARTVPKRTSAAIRRSSSGLRQEQPQANHHRNLAARQRQRHQGLTIRSLAQGRRILRPDPDRMRPLLRQRRVVDDEEGVGAADSLVRLDRKLKLQRTLVPDPVRTKWWSRSYRPAPPARPSGRCSCDRPARSAPPHRADTSAASPCAQTVQRTAPGAPQGLRAKPRFRGQTVNDDQAADRSRAPGSLSGR
jgi:hypothetical protein